MEGMLLLVPGVVLSVAYLLQPLRSERVEAPWSQFKLLGDDSEAEDRVEQSSRPAPRQDGRRAMTDGGRVCHSCGAHVEGEYLYCAECLTPRV